MKEKREIAKGPHTINAANVASTRDLIRQKKIVKANCKADRRERHLQPPNMAKTKLLSTVTILLYWFVSCLVSLNVFQESISLAVCVNLKGLFWLGIMVSTQISRARFKQSEISLPILHIYVSGCFV